MSDEFSLRDLRKYLIGASGGFLSRDYYSLLDVPLLDLIPDLEIFSEYQTEQQDKSKNGITNDSGGKTTEYFFKPV